MAEPTHRMALAKAVQYLGKREGLDKACPAPKTCTLPVLARISSFKLPKTQTGHQPSGQFLAPLLHV